MPRSVLHPLRQAGTERFFCLISCIGACNIAVYDTYDTAGSEKPLPFSSCTDETPSIRSICNPFSLSLDSAQSRGRDTDRDAVRCMGHLAWCPKKWGSWLVSSIVRYQPAGMPCRTTMCFMVHKVNDTYNEVMYLHGPCLVW